MNEVNTSRKLNFSQKATAPQLPAHKLFHNISVYSSFVRTTMGTESAHTLSHFRFCVDLFNWTTAAIGLMVNLARVMPEFSLIFTVMLLLDRRQTSSFREGLDRTLNTFVPQGCSVQQESRLLSDSLHTPGARCCSLIDTHDFLDFHHF